METTLEINALYVVSSFPTGSHTICNPPVTDTDIDTMILVTNLDAVKSLLHTAGWECSGRQYPGRVEASWASYKKGNLNYLITDTLAYYNDFKTATELATKLNLREKEQRITLFNYILAEWEDEEEEEHDVSSATFAATDPSQQETRLQWSSAEIWNLWNLH